MKLYTFYPSCLITIIMSSDGAEYIPLRKISSNSLDDMVRVTINFPQCVELLIFIPFRLQKKNRHESLK